MKIYMYNCETAKLMEKETIDEAAIEVLQQCQQHHLFMMKIDVSDGYPIVNENSVLKTYNAGPTTVGPLSFKSTFGWKYSIHPEGDSTDPIYTSDFDGSFDMVKKYQTGHTWVYLWPINSQGLPLGL